MNNSNVQTHWSQGPYITALVALCIFIPVPVLATMLTLLIYFTTGWMPIWVILGGLGLTAPVLLGLAYFFRLQVSAETAKQSDYLTFQSVRQSWFTLLKHVIVHLTVEGALFPEEESRIAQIYAAIDRIDSLLEKKGLIWVLRAGYLDLWNQANKIDEEIIDILTPEQLTQTAQRDIARLCDSAVPDNKILIRQLEPVIKDLQELAPYSSISLPQAPLQKARNTIRNVEHILHQYTYDRWGKLVRASNQLLGTALLASGLLYAVVILGLFNVDNRDTMAFMITYYLFGALIGMFARIVDEFKADADIAHMDDYGLTTARIMVTPLLCGLAVLVGLPLISIAIPLAQHGKVHDGQVILECFNFIRNPTNFLWAAIVAYLPSTVINLLQQQTGSLQKQIQSSNAAGSESTK